MKIEFDWPRGAEHFGALPALFDEGKVFDTVPAGAKQHHDSKEATGTRRPASLRWPDGGGKCYKPAMSARCRIPSLVLLAFLLGCARCAQAQDSQAPTLRERLQAPVEERRLTDGEAVAKNAGSAKLGPGNHMLYLDQGGLHRKALVHIPPGYDGARPMALVLAFHGGGGHAEYMADDERYGLGRKADLEGFVVAYPNGFSRFPGGRLATWNAGACCGEARDRRVDDVGFVRALVAAIEERVSIDRSRVFAVGMSNGGMMSYRLACEAADVFHAVASVAGTDVTTACLPSRPVSVLHIHAKDDDHVLFGGGAGQGAFRDLTKVTAFTSVPETMARWVRHDRCSSVPRRVLERPGAYCEAYDGCAGGVSVELCVTAEGGHSWPGASLVRSGKQAASKALSADDVIWDFFKSTVQR